jgi:hypothetical protein
MPCSIPERRLGPRHGRRHLPPLHAQWFAEITRTSLTRSRIVVGGDRNYPPMSFWMATASPPGSPSI